MGLQVHGSDLLGHTSAQDPSPYAHPGNPLPEVDGHFTASPGPRAAGAGRRLPAGRAGRPRRRGDAALRLARTCGRDRGQRESRAVAAEAAAIGPGIGPCCYEVGAEVLERFAGLGEGIADGRMLDLAEVARRQLRAAGVERVESAGLCTSCEPELFFSHRRDGERSGRQGGLVWLREAG